MLSKLNLQSILRIETYRSTDGNDDNNDLKKLITYIDRLCGMAKSRKRCLHKAEIGTKWGHHARSKILSTEDFVVTIEILHEVIDYLIH